LSPKADLRPVGEAAVAVELGDGIDPEVNARVRALDRLLGERPFPGFREAVPTYRSLLVLYDPQAASLEAVAEHLLSLPAASHGPEPGPERMIPVRYGGEHGPDLAEVAERCGLSEAEVVSLHSGTVYTAFMLGFTPGFAYLGTLPEALALPRRATPRTRVPAGTVAIAVRQTGIYPATSPGGWHLLGRTSERLFDPTADPPSLILPGDRVRFVPVSELPEATAAAPAPRASSRLAIEVTEGGLLTTVQDAGRFGLRRLGVTWAGPMDSAAHAAANRAAGNSAGAAALECTVAGPTLQFLAPLHFAVAGTDLGAVLHRADLGAWRVPLGRRVFARPGNVLSFTGRRSGCRAYIACAGGIDVPAVLGSRATDLTGGFGGLDGRALRAGDRLAVGRTAAAAPVEEAATPAADPASVTVRVILGPQQDHFPPESIACFLGESYEVKATSDRVGCRLSGRRLVHSGPAEIVSDGMLPGCVQVPPDGQPIVMMADAPTTGGYPKIATVLAADLRRLAQLLPGEGRVCFEAVAYTA
jgi:KipI family sensor histidine kinase inhibitor